MKLGHIKNLLQISCTFNMSSIRHSFSIREKDTLMARCLKDTFILEIISDYGRQVEYYTSLDQAAEALHEKIHADKTT